MLASQLPEQLRSALPAILAGLPSTVPVAWTSAMDSTIWADTTTGAPIRVQSTQGAALGTLGAGGMGANRVAGVEAERSPQPSASACSTRKSGGSQSLDPSHPPHYKFARRAQKSSICFMEILSQSELRVIHWTGSACSNGLCRSATAYLGTGWKS